MVSDLVPATTSGESKSDLQERNKEEERTENRRTVEGINDDGDMGYYSDLDSIYQDYVKAKLSMYYPQEFSKC